MVGTSVRDRKNDKAMASITASARGTNKKRDTPSRKNMGTNTIQMHSSDTKAGVTICAASSQEKALKASGNAGGAKVVGAALAERAKAAGITSVVFDRGGFAYHGRVAAFADALRKGGLEF